MFVSKKKCYILQDPTILSKNYFLFNVLSKAMFFKGLINLSHTQFHIMLGYQLMIGLQH